MPSLWIPGEPTAKGRPRFGQSGRVYTPEPTRQAERKIANAWWAPVIALEIPVAVRLTFYHQRPASHFLKSGNLSLAGRRLPVPMKRPDLDNCIKLVLDALNGVAYRDDSQVQSIEALRYWAGGEVEAGVMVQVRELRPAELGGSSPT